MEFLKSFRTIALILLYALLLTSCSMPMQEGVAWLDTKAAAPKLNVSGTWMCQEFSMAQLTQEGRDITGTFYGGGLIKGVVSGESIHLLIYDAYTVLYMATLEAVDEKAMKGEYVRAYGHSNDWDNTGRRPISLVKMPIQ